jgi:hypothetical protein
VKSNATVGGPNGHRSNGSEIEGRPDPRLKTGVPDGMPNGGRTGVPDGGQTGWPDGCHIIGHIIFECHVIGHVIGHVIFECHVTHLGW